MMIIEPKSSAEQTVSCVDKPRHAADSSLSTEYCASAWQQNSDNLLSLLNSSEDIIWTVDRERKLLFANKAAQAAFARRRDIELTPGMRVEEIFTDINALLFDKLYDSALRGQTLRLNLSADDQREYATTIQPVRKADQIIGISVFARDISNAVKLKQELKLIDTLVNTTNDLIALLDSSYHFHYVNRAYREAFKHVQSELVGLSLQEVVGRETFTRTALPNLQKAFAGEKVQFEVWQEIPNGNRFFSVSYSPLLNGAEPPDLIAIIARDLTELKRVEDDRQKIFELSLDMLCVSSFAGHFLELNPSWHRTLGWSAEELKSKDWLDLVFEDDRERSLSIQQRLAKGDSVIGFENRCYCKDGTLRWLSWSSSPEKGQKRVFSVVRDITNQKQIEDRLRQLATTDPLTGASNRRHFIERAMAELKRSHRHGTPLAAVMLDIDHFKRINDSYGHDVGDEVLKRMVNCCQQELRASDIFGRFGGEEFAAILTESDRDAAGQICERLRQSVAALRIQHAGSTIAINISIGASMYTINDINIDSLLKRADDALYEAKRKGA